MINGPVPIFEYEKCFWMLSCGMLLADFLLFPVQYSDMTNKFDQYNRSHLAQEKMINTLSTKMLGTLCTDHIVLNWLQLQAIDGLYTLNHRHAINTLKITHPFTEIPSELWDQSSLLRQGNKKIAL